MFPVNRLIEKKILSSINRLVHILIDMSCVSEDQKDPYMQEAVELIRDIRPYLLSLIEGKEVLLESLLRQLISQKLPHPSVLRSFGDLQRDLNRIIHASLQSGTEEEITESQQLDTDEKIIEDLPAQAETANAGDENGAETPSLVNGNGEGQPDVTAAAEEEAGSGSAADLEACEQLLAETAAESATKTEEPAGAPVDAFVKMPKPEEPSDLLQNIIPSIYADEVIIKDYIFRSLPINYYLPDRKTAIITSNRRKTKLHDLLLKKEGITVFEITPEECRNIYLLSRKLPRFS